jgi:RimJ/RimL family protein N-acetyltransferase
MNDLVVAGLSALEAPSLSDLLTSDDTGYSQYFIPFANDRENLEKILRSANEDRYWGLWFASDLAGFFMLRGFDEGYRRPSFGVYIARKYSGRGLSGLALAYCICWCRMNGIKEMMLKVHPDNYHAHKTYEKAGFKVVDTCRQTGHFIMEKRLREG